MTNGVTVKYSEYGHNSTIEQAIFELMENVELQLDFDAEHKTITMSMAEMEVVDSAISGTLSVEKIDVLVRVLSQLKGQLLKAESEDGEEEIETEEETETV
jgi:hypothetical protein